MTIKNSGKLIELEASKNDLELLNLAIHDLSNSFPEKEIQFFLKDNKVKMVISYTVLYFWVALQLREEEVLPMSIQSLHILRAC